MEARIREPEPWPTSREELLGSVWDWIGTERLLESAGPVVDRFLEVL
jgi:hypothetical protein